MLSLFERYLRAPSQPIYPQNPSLKSTWHTLIRQDGEVQAPLRVQWTVSYLLVVTIEVRADALKILCDVVLLVQVIACTWICEQSWLMCATSRFASSMVPTNQSKPCCPLSSEHGKQGLLVFIMFGSAQE